MKQFGSYTSGEIAKFLKVCPRSGSKFLDRYAKDLVYRFSKHRRITHTNFMRALVRAGITPEQLGMSFAQSLAWIGGVVEDFVDESDLNLSLVGTLAALDNHQLSAIAAVEGHGLSINDIEDLAKMCESRCVRVAIRLPDDVAQRASTAKYVCLYNNVGYGNLVKIFKWLRNEKRSDASNELELDTA